MFGDAVPAREDFRACFRDVARVGVRLQKTRPPRTQGMHYMEPDGVFAQRLSTVGAEIPRALPKTRTAVYVEKGVPLH